MTDNDDKMVLAQHTFEPNSITEAMTVAKTLVASRLLPKAVTTPEAAFAIIMTGREMGLTAMQSLRSIHVVEGRPTMSADLMAALVKRSPECEWFRLVSSTAEVAVYEAKRRGEPEPTRMSFSFDEAKAAGLTSKDNYRKFPAAMLRARCIAALARAVFPDVMLGVYELDELTPAPPQVAAAKREELAGEAVQPDVAESAAACANFRIGIDSSKTTTELEEVGKAIGAAFKQGTLTRDDRNRLGEAYAAKKTALMQAAPSKPAVVDGEIEAAQ
jgi:hypothetical protein